MPHAHHVWLGRDRILQAIRAITRAARDPASAEGKVDEYTDCTSRRRFCESSELRRLCQSHNLAEITRVSGNVHSAELLGSSPAT